MGLTTWQLERLIAGQPLARTQQKRKRSARRIRPTKQPVALLIAAAESAHPVRPASPAVVAVPCPGSDDAVTAGCICPVFGNRHGRGLEGRDGVFEYVLGCPLHMKEIAA